MSHTNRTGVLLIHGLTGSPTEMAPVEKALRRAGYQTAVPLITGHGAGHKELLATTWQQWRDGLRRDIREFAQRCDEVVIVGLCVGGLLGLLLAAEEESVHGVVSLSPDIGFRLRGPMLPWTRVLLPLAYRVPILRRYGYWTQCHPYGIKNPRLQQRLAKAVAASIRGQTKEYGTFRTYVGTMLELKRLQREVTRQLARVRCPALIIHSVEDSLFDIRNAALVYRRLGSIHKKLAFITGCDHVMTVDLRKEDVIRRVERFLIGRQGVSTDGNAPDDEFLSCEIVPAHNEAERGAVSMHTLTVRKGAADRLILPLYEAPASRSPQLADQPQNPELEAEWRLASAAIHALNKERNTHFIVSPNNTANRSRTVPTWTEQSDTTILPATSLMAGAPHRPATS